MQDRWLGVALLCLLWMTCSPAEGERRGPALAPASSGQGLLGADGVFVAKALGEQINRYASLAQDATAGQTTLRIDSTQELQAQAGDLILIIQMQGALLDTTDGPTYGRVLSINQAGAYEVATVGAVDAGRNELTLTGCSGLRGSYSAAGRSQVVRVPQLVALSVPRGTSVVAKPWDGKTGGVLAAYVRGQAVVAGELDASAAGFRGGATDNTSATPPAGVLTYRTTSGVLGAEKGEGIGGGAADYDGAGGRYGRGAPANGGGGGNAHHAGGGGGAGAGNPASWSGQGVMTTPTADVALAWRLDPGYARNGNQLTQSSGGGRGGYSLSTMAANPTTLAPGAVGWGGDERREVGGLGGQPLAATPLSRLFLGGGGGAGDGSTGSSGAGGRGGGIVFLVADQISGEGVIRADGMAGGSTPGGTLGRDGGGGGGGGGSIVILASRSADRVTVQAKGGTGGSQEVSNGDSAAGPGGGGGGGLFAMFQPTGSVVQAVDGAISGGTDQPALVRFVPNGATNGSPGQGNLAILRSDAPQLPLCVPSDIRVTAAHVRGQLAIGEPAELQVTVSNLGPQPAVALQLSDVLTPTLNGAVGSTSWTCRARLGTGCPATAGTGPLTAVIDLLVGEVLTFTRSVTLGAGFGAAGLDYQVRAQVVPGYQDPTPGDGEASLHLPLGALPGADLAMTVLTLPGAVRPSERITYSVVVSSLGPGTATGATFFLDLPNEVLLPAEVAAPTGWSCTQVARRLTCAWAQGLAIGVLPAVSVTVQAGNTPGNLHVVGSATGTGISDPFVGNNGVEIWTPVGLLEGADVQASLNSSPNPLLRRGTVSYSLRLLNNGPATVPMARLRFDLTSGGVITSVDAQTGWQCEETALSVDCTRQEAQPPGVYPGLLVHVEPLATAPRVIARLFGVGLGVLEVRPENNVVTETNPIGQEDLLANLSLTVTTDPARPRPGEPISYLATVASQLPGVALGLRLRCTFPQGQRLVQVVAAPDWACTPVPPAEVAGGGEALQVDCSYAQSLTPGSTLAPVSLRVQPTAEAMVVGHSCTVLPKGAIDPMTMDNTVSGETLVREYIVGGGGLTCALAGGVRSRAAAEPGAPVGTAFVAGLLLLLRRRRHRVRRADPQIRLTCLSRTE